MQHPRRARGGRSAWSRAVATLVVGAVAALGGVAVAGSAQAAPGIDTGAWYSLVSWRSKKAVDVAGSSTASGTAVAQWTPTGATNQQFQFVAVGGGFYEVRARHSGLALTIATGSGSLATQSTPAGAATQQFTVAAGSSGRIKLVSRASGLALQVVGASKENGARLEQAADTNANHQQFTLVAQGSAPSPTTPAPTASATPRPTAGATPRPTAGATPTATARPTPPPATGAWPTPTSSQKVSATIEISGTKDMGLVRYHGISSGDQGESQPPMFRLADGAVLRNVILGTGAGDGIHCTGTCTVENVWFEDVGEDAATFKGTSASQTMTINGGGARSASDKVFQHNGPGTFVIKNFQVSDIGKLYRSCGNCSTQHARTVVVQNVTVTAPAKSLVGINPNLGDKATLSGLTIVGDPAKKIAICEEYKGVTSGEPSKVSSGPSAACGYTPSTIVYR
ncbi:pectate lyase [Cellulomonas sp. NS3]|uniref:pectate lyase n=1 Tax=Cellulomonas sp. NS3 TaxID=2973977 RepID=UPI002163E577|nr:pectate lyase [Cellulomonas sp. NS3]